MDAQGRGRAENIDPADQWVLNPNTGDYELRLDPSAGQSNVPGPRRSARTATAQRRRSPAPGREHADRGPEVPVQRRHRHPDDLPPGRRRPRPKPRRSRAKKILLWVCGVLAFLVLAAGVGAYLYWDHLNDNLDGIDTDGAGTGGFSKDRPINVLLIGTDKRTGKGNAGYGDSGSAGHADTTVLLHVSKDRSNATALSIPRDMITDIPTCPTKQEDGSTKDIPGTQQTRFNESLGQNGRTPSCTMRTVNKITGLDIDHFMMADFNAVKTLSSAVGGVPVCVAKDIDDPKSHLKLSKGKHNLAGDDALAYVRTRYSVGTGGDLSRIELQQQFLSSLMRKMKSNDTLTSPTKLLGLAEAATKALTVDSQIADLDKLKDLGLELGKADLKNISFTTVPVVDNTDGATVLLNEAQADPLFSMLQADQSLTETKKKKKAAEQARLKGPKADASEVRVNIYNGSETQGAAGTTLSWLQNEQGVLKASQLGNAPENQARTTLEYAPGQADEARRLAEIMGLPASAMKPGKSEKNSQGMPAMTLILGADFKEAGTPISAPTKVPDGVRKVEADKAVCAK
ncbi:putative transcriptional regulator YwtF [Streptomyces sp. YIM 130001]|uniref:LCP family protein n=1 Tax=Streptomyces sp. YIM 130001 TaxID=2259644 RepID=UPI000E64B3C3|nr:LCP family protein [Streptomyces sp. YIM 130001]RII15121.1 putative transcriptional regulator YwtF [Streptomyces sp. YIM 130001]